MTDKKRGGGRIASNEGPKSKRQRKSNTKPPSSHEQSTIPHLDTPLPSLLPHQRIDLIATLCESVLEDPTAAVSSTRTANTHANDTNKEDDDDNNPNNQQYSKTPSKLSALLHLASPLTNGHDGHAARLAIVSLLAVFQDILPSYRIRLPTASETAVKVSKDIKKTWDYERRLLSGYQSYLTLLEKTWEGGRRGTDFTGSAKSKRHGGGAPTTLAATAIVSLSALLRTNYNFNFRSNILSIVIRCASRSNEDIRRACCSSLKVMFTDDTGGEASLEAVRRMAKLMKDKSKKKHHHGRGMSVYKDLLDCWMSLPLRVHEDEAAAGECGHIYTHFLSFVYSFDSMMHASGNICLDFLTSRIITL